MLFVEGLYWHRLLNSHFVDSFDFLSISWVSSLTMGALLDLWHSSSHELCTQFCVVLFCYDMIIEALCGYMTIIHPYSLGFLDCQEDIIKWIHFPCYWSFVRGIHWSLVDSPNKGQWHRALMFSLICAWTNGWATNCDAGNCRLHHTHYDVTITGTGKMHDCSNAS